MRRATYILCGLLLMGATVLWMYHSLSLPYPYRINLWTDIALPIVVLCMGTGLLFYGVFAENIYRIRQGVVINHRFTPAHTTPMHIIPQVSTANGVTTVTNIIIPEQHHPDDWALELEDAQGHTGTLHFETNVFGNYPIGSMYP